MVPFHQIIIHGWVIFEEPFPNPQFVSFGQTLFVRKHILFAQVFKSIGKMHNKSDKFTKCNGPLRFQTVCVDAAF